MNNTFKREQKYLVIKVKDAKHYLDEDQLEQLAGIADTIEARRKAVGLTGLECVVIESHWPEYEATWKAIEARFTDAPMLSVLDVWVQHAARMATLARKLREPDWHFESIREMQRELYALEDAALATAPGVKP